MLDPSASMDGTWALPPECYTQAQYSKRENEQVFGTNWLPACRVEQVAQAGSYVALNLGGEPLVVSRDQAGQLHAFTNICRHRAARVAPEGCGTAIRFSCPYHGWMYDLAGKLTGIPQGDGMTCFKREENPLPAWHLEVWDRWVWVHPPHASPGLLEEQLGPLQNWLGERLADFHWVETREYRIGCDWKVFVDNYLDGGYHVGPVHPGLSAGLLARGYKTEIFGSASLQSCPMSGPAEGGMAWYWHLWPAWMINIYGDTADTNLVLPDGPGRCRVLFDWFMRGELEPGRVARALESSDQVQREDMHICEEVQSNLASRFYRGGPFVPKRELAGWSFHQNWARAMGFGLKGEKDD